MMAAILMNPMKLGGDFVVARCDSAPLLELCKEALDAPAGLIGDAVVAVLIFSMTARWNDRFATLFKDNVMQAIGAIGAVGEHMLGRQPPDDVAGRSQIVLLAGSR